MIHLDATDIIAISRYRRFGLENDYSGQFEADYGDFWPTKIVLPLI